MSATFDPNRQYTEIVAADGNVTRFDPTWPGGVIMSTSVQNLSTVDVLVSDNAGRGYTVPSGNNRTVNFPATQVNVKAVQAGSGFIGVTIFADQQTPADTGGSVNANIINSVINATIQGTITALISGTVNTNLVNSSINTLITNAILSMQDVIVENNTTVTAGILANTVVALSLTQGVTFMQPIPKAVQGFALVLNNPGGFLDVWYTVSGQDNYQVVQYPFYELSKNLATTMEKQFDADIPAGSVLKILFRQGTSNPVTGELKY